MNHRVGHKAGYRATSRHRMAHPAEGAEVFKQPAHIFARCYGEVLREAVKNGSQNLYININVISPDGYAGNEASVFGATRAFRPRRNYSRRFFSLSLADTRPLMRGTALWDAKVG